MVYFFSFLQLVLRVYSVNNPWCLTIWQTSIVRHSSVSYGYILSVGDSFCIFSTSFVIKSTARIVRDAM